MDSTDYGKMFEKLASNSEDFKVEVIEDRYEVQSKHTVKTTVYIKRTPRKSWYQRFYEFWQNKKSSHK